jgi:hypothetical protein
MLSTNASIGFDFGRFLPGAMRHINHAGGDCSREQQNTNARDDEYGR